MQFNHIKSQDRRRVTLDVTPLVDVVFLLLIFLLLTMAFAAPAQESKKEAVVDIELAQSSTASEDSPVEAVDVYLDGEGKLFVNDEIEKKPNELKELLIEKNRQNDLLVNLKSDRRASHGQFIEALDLIKSAGVSRVNVVVESHD